MSSPWNIEVQVAIVTFAVVALVVLLIFWALGWT
jgi:hypothetical protein